MPDRHAARRPWVIDLASVRAMESLEPGQELTIVKRDAAGKDVATYPGRVVESTADSPWVEIEALWTIPGLEPEGGLAFVPGDIMREFFSPVHPFNAFAVYTPEGVLRGWYGNVTYPTTMEREGSVTRLIWQDLYLDVVILPDGTMAFLDEEDLAESGLPERDPEFAAAIIAARDDLIRTIHQLPNDPPATREP